MTEGIIAFSVFFVVLLGGAVSLGLIVRRSPKAKKWLS
jgi:hypothetical protein